LTAQGGAGRRVDPQDGRHRRVIIKSSLAQAAPKLDAQGHVLEVGGVFRPHPHGSELINAKLASLVAYKSQKQGLKPTSFKKDRFHARYQPQLRKDSHTLETRNPTGLLNIEALLEVERKAPQSCTEELQPAQHLSKQEWLHPKAKGEDVQCDGLVIQRCQRPNWKRPLCGSPTIHANCRLLLAVPNLPHTSARAAWDRRSRQRGSSQRIPQWCR
jgi:hypothetical protein